MREVQYYLTRNYTYDRITPAYAGSTNLGTIQQIQSQDHPRVCGKYVKLSRLMYPPQGSPPRMREVLFSPIYNSYEPRITPAYAGSTDT